MKKSFDSLLLFLPALLWGLGSYLLGDTFTLPNRLMLALLCTAAGAGALLAGRKPPGLLALVAGVAMLATVPVEHEVPQAMLTPPFSIPYSPPLPSAPLTNGFVSDATDCLQAPEDTGITSRAHLRLQPRFAIPLRYDHAKDSITQTLLYSPLLRCLASAPSEPAGVAG